MFTLKLLGASALAVLIAFGAGYYRGHVACSEAAQVRQLQEAVTWLNAEIARREARTQADNAAREADRAELERLDETIRELSDELQDRDGCGLSDDTVDRLRRSWGR